MCVSRVHARCQLLLCEIIECKCKVTVQFKIPIQSAHRILDSPIALWVQLPCFHPTTHNLHGVEMITEVIYNETSLCQTCADSVGHADLGRWCVGEETHSVVWIQTPQRSL